VKHRRKIVVDKNLKPYDPGPYPGDDDDGFNDRSDTSRSVIHLRWSAEQGWRGSNGLAPPEPQLVIKAETVVRRWQNKLPTDIRTKPLPDVDQLNASVPIAEWEFEVDGKTKRPPYALTVLVHCINQNTGELSTYASATTGGRIAYEHLKNSVANMRKLRGEPSLVPLIEFAEEPFPTRFGLKKRPAFAIAGWQTFGDSGALPAAPPPLQLPPSAAAPSSEPAAEPAEPASNVETLPPRGGRGRGKITTTSGRQKDTRPAGNGPDDPIPF
jgi:hypothetical protein